MGLKPARKRLLATMLQEEHGASQRRACGLLDLHRATARCVSRRDPRTALRVRIRELALARPRYGYRRLHILLKREGWVVGHRTVFKHYTDMGLQVRAASLIES